MMVKTTTQKCSCGYILKKEEKTEIRSIPEWNDFELVPCKKKRSNTQSNNFRKEQQVVSSEILQGDDEFITLQLMSNYDSISDNGKYQDFTVCPKCGAVLVSSFAMTVIKANK